MSVANLVAMFMDRIGIGRLYKALRAGSRKSLQVRPAERSQRAPSLNSSDDEEYSNIWTRMVHSRCCQGGRTLEEGHSGSLVAERETAGFFLELTALDRGSGVLAGREGVRDGGLD